MFVKICGMTNADDALLAAGLGADAVGFIFAASSRRVSPGRVRNIVRRLPPGVMPVGVFRDESKERVVAAASDTGIRIVQLHGSEPPTDVDWISQRVDGVIKALSFNSPMIRYLSDYSARIMVDAPSPGGGVAFDWHRIAPSLLEREFILAGGLNPDNVASAVRAVRPWGVDVATGVEARPGIKDPVKLRKFIAAAKTAAEPDDTELDDI